MDQEDHTNIGQTNALYANKEVIADPNCLYELKWNGYRIYLILTAAKSVWPPQRSSKQD